MQDLGNGLRLTIWGELKGSFTNYPLLEMRCSITTARSVIRTRRGLLP
jgi:hypothetical protein